MLTDLKNPKQYIKRMKQRNPELKKGWVQIVHTLEINITLNFLMIPSVFCYFIFYFPFSIPHTQKSTNIPTLLTKEG